jgi:hypothetical protein
MNNAIRKPTLLIENESTADVFLAVKIKYLNTFIKITDKDLSKSSMCELLPSLCVAGGA